MSKTSIKEIIFESAYDSTMHSIRHIFKRENWCLKLFWMVCFATSASVCAYMISKSIMAYFLFETVTKAETIYELPAAFPAVSICNLNPYMSQQAFDFSAAYLRANNITDEYAIYGPYWSTGFYFLMHYSIGVSIRMAPNLTDKMRQEMGWQINDMILACSFNQQDCNSSNFVWYFDNVYGSCYSFNLDNTNYIKKSGSINGLNLELFVGEPTNKYSFAYTKGLFVEVHNQSRLPMFYDGFTANVGESTQIAVDREYSSRLETPYSECVRDIGSYASQSIYVRTLLEANITYRQTDCLNVCLQGYVVGRCGCYLAEYPYCPDMATLCQGACPLECDSVTYTISTSTSVYPSYVFGHNLMNNVKVQALFSQYMNRTSLRMEDLVGNLLKISVYYNDLSYQSFNEAVKMDVFDLVSNVGGTLGLFLGMSFLSFVEIIDLIFSILFTCFKFSTKIHHNYIN